MKIIPNSPAESMPEAFFPIQGISLFYEVINCELVDLREILIDHFQSIDSNIIICEIGDNML